MNNFPPNAKDNKQFLTSKLGKRYQIGKAAISARLNALDINLIKQGKNFVINGEQLQLMDDLNTHLKAGGRMEKFVQQRLESGKIVPLQEPKGEAIVLPPDAPVVTATPQPQQELIVEEIEISAESSQQEWIEERQAEKGEQVLNADIQEVDKRAQERAFNKAVVEETLTVIYEATEQFTIPGLKEELHKHREDCKKARQKRSDANNVNHFFSQALKIARQEPPQG